MATKPSEIAESVSAETPVKLFAAMSEAELAEWDRGFISALEAGDDSAARASLASGFPIYYALENTPENTVIKEYPDGRKELVALVNDEEKVVRAL